MSDSLDFLLWVRGPGMVIAVSVFLFGMVLRLIEIYGIGRHKDLAPPREPRAGSGWRTIISRSFAPGEGSASGIITHVVGYTFHIGLFVVLLLFGPHIQFFRETLGVSWPGLPSTVVDLVAAISIIALLVALVSRLVEPVKRFLSGFEDYFTWALTFLPFVTGYMSFHHMLLPYTTMLALHILSVELLMVVLPFSKLIHSVTLFPSRWYNGDSFSRKGVRS